MRKEEQSLKFWVSRKAENNPLMAECKRLIAAWKEPDKAAAGYEKPLHDKYQSLKIELEQLWKVKIMVIPVIVGALGAIADRLPG